MPSEAPLAEPSAEAVRKEKALLAILRRTGRTMVALSGGVDSSYLAWAAHRALGEDSLAVTAISPSYPAHHREMAEKVVADLGLRHRFVETREMQRSAYRVNGPDRCYHCKSELFSELESIGRELGFPSVAYGVNIDDTADYRPGHRAADEHRVLSPFIEVELSKREIRALSRAAGLPTWDLPASACLASRLPYGSEVTPEKLAQVEEGEARIRALGFDQLRLRHHGDIARLEIDPREMAKAQDPEVMRAIVAAIKPLGFRWVCLDLEGYRMGSLNDVLLVVDG